MMGRRGFLGSILALAAAPAIVRAEWMTPVRPVGDSWIRRSVPFPRSILLCSADGRILRRALAIEESPGVYFASFAFGAVGVRGVVADSAILTASEGEQPIKHTLVGARMFMDGDILDLTFRATS